MVQAKFFPHLPAGESWAALFQARLRQIAVFEVFNVALDEFAGVVGFCPSRAFRQFGQSPLDVRVKPDRKHSVVPPSYILYTYDGQRTIILSRPAPHSRRARSFVSEKPCDPSVDSMRQSSGL